MRATSARIAEGWGHMVPRCDPQVIRAAAVPTTDVALLPPSQIGAGLRLGPVFFRADRLSPCPCGPNRAGDTPSAWTPREASARATLGAMLGAFHGASLLITPAASAAGDFFGAAA
jgi:hypothetical protein